MGRAERVERGPWGGGLVAKGLMVCWWQVSFKEPRQGGLCQKDVGCRGWGGFSKGAAGGWQYVWTGPGRQGVGNMSHSKLRVSLPFWFSDYIQDQKVCGVYCRDTQKAATSAELTTARSYSCSARGRLLGKHGGVGPPPISPSSRRLSEQTLIVSS